MTTSPKTWTIGTEYAPGVRILAMENEGNGEVSLDLDNDFVVVEPGTPDNLIRSSVHGDWYTCRCGNEPMYSGWLVSTAEGIPVDDHADGPWDGKHWVCAGCGIVVDQSTFVVVDQDDEENGATVTIVFAADSGIVTRLRAGAEWPDFAAAA